MRRSLGKEQQIARLHLDLFHKPHVVFIGAHFVRRRLCQLVAPGDNRESTVSGTTVGKLPRDRDSATVDLAVLLMVPRRLAERFATSVEPVTFRTLLRLDHQRAVIEPEALPAELVEPRNHERVDEQFPERLAILRLPPEHARQFDTAGGTRQRFRSTRQPAGVEMSGSVHVRVENAIQFRDLGLAQHVGNHQIAA